MQTARSRVHARQARSDDHQLYDENVKLRDQLGQLQAALEAFRHENAHLRRKLAVAVEEKPPAPWCAAGRHAT